MRAAGTDLRTCRIGNADSGLEVIIEDGVAKMPDRTCFAGSIATTDRLVRNMVRLAGAPLASAVQMATITPARILGIGNRKGMIAPGYDADVVVFDQDVNVRMTIVRGEVVFDATASAP
jgi:N-acetylglucosamine-6-phosphate deacetylase